VYGERQVPRLARLDSTRVLEQELLHGFRLALLGDHANEVGDRRHYEAGSA
jgi:hypothetical protein